MNEKQRTDLALWRFSVLGPLVSAELQHGDVRRLCRQAASRSYRRPDGRRVELKPRTIESWYYAHRSHGLGGLKPAGRSDAGCSRAIEPAVAQRLVALKRDNRRRSIRRLIRMLERSGEVARGTLRRTTVHRFLKSQGLNKRPPRHGDRERRAFRHRFAGECWMADVMHGPKVVAPDGKVRKAYLHAYLDSATRLVPGAAFRLAERAVDFEAVLKMAVRRYGVPRILYTDNGSAQSADSLRLICAELGIQLLHCRPYDPEAKGGIERFFNTVRAEIVDELGDEPRPLGELNGLLWAWLSTEYHSRNHAGTGRVPLEHWLGHAERLRPSPDADTLERIFMHRETRRVRRDSTVRFGGHLLEVRGELAGDQVELRFDPEIPFDPDDRTTWPQVWADGRFACDSVVLDRVANSARARRPLPRHKEPDTAPTGIDPLAQMADEQARKTRRPKDMHDEEEV